MRLLQVQLDDVKDELLSCTREQLPFVREKGLVYEELIRMITRPSIKTLTTTKE